MTIKPVHNFILIQQSPEEKSLIQLPDGVKNPLQQWVVLAVAEETKCVKVGDKILIIPDARIIQIDRERVIGMMHDNAVVGIVD